MYTASVKFRFSEDLSGAEQLRKIASYLEAFSEGVGYVAKSNRKVALISFRPSITNEIEEKIRNEQEQGILTSISPKL